MKIHPSGLAATSAAAHARIAFLVLLLGVSTTSLTASEAKSSASDSLFVANAWSRATLPGLDVGAAYFTIVNGGTHSDTLVSLASPAAATAKLHQTTMDNGMSRMRPTGPMVIAPGQTLKIEPGGLHVMLTGLKHPLITGTKVPLVLTFKQAGAITVQLDVQSATAMSPTSVSH